MNYQDFELKEYASANERLWEASQAFPVLMRKVYIWMTLALDITGFTAYGVATSPGIMQAIFTNQILFWGLIIAEFALVIGVSAAIHKLSLTTATLMFILYSVINGATMSVIFLIYEVSSIATVFFITAGTFMGGYNIIKTMGKGMATLKKYQAFATDIAASIALLLATFFGLPVSTGTVKSTAIMGGGAARSFRRVKWPVAGRMVMWGVIVFPASALVGFILVMILVWTCH